MKLPCEVAVVGAGTMGVGIARVFAAAGVSVRLCARREASLEAARGRLAETAAQVRLTTAADEALDGAELVIETIVEEAEPKRDRRMSPSWLRGNTDLPANSSAFSPV